MGYGKGRLTQPTNSQHEKEGNPIGNVVGNLTGLKPVQRKRLERIARGRVPRDIIISPEMARSLTEISAETRRQIGVLIDRAGQIETLMVGDNRSIVIPSLDSFRSGKGRLRGLRCVHTHPAGEDLSRDDLLDLLFLRLDLMAVIKIMGDGLPERIYAAHLVPRPVDQKNWLFLPPVVPTQQLPNFLSLINALEEEFSRLRPMKAVEQDQDRAILISVTSLHRARAMESVLELMELARSDEITVFDTIIQRRDKVNHKWIMGKGKLGEVMLAALQQDVNLLIFDQELNPSQIRSITDHTELRVIDRTQLILDIFARRALSREGKLQIEMAQLKYLLPRLTKRDDALSRLTGGIGGRGPGETRLEVDRRRVRERLKKLTDDLLGVSRQRSERRGRRRKRDLPVISLVGYTNAGKSTLLNTLTQSHIIVEDKLFATLDPTSRRLKFPQDQEVIITDTVGFIRDLPEELVQAFKATLEELFEADLLVHVIDVSNPRFPEQLKIVEDLLSDLGLGKIPIMRVLNKADRMPADYVLAQCRIYEALSISALDSGTLTPFLDRAQAMVLRGQRPVDAVVSG